MSRLIKNVRGNNLVEFDRGSFDEWCVFLTRPGKLRYAPKDTEYFTILKNMGNVFGHAKIYNDFISFYTPTTLAIDKNILDLITTISDDYGVHAEEMDTWFTVIYAGMIAEENKKNKKLGKKIKRLGMHQVLLEGQDPVMAASFSRGQKWQDLEKIMKGKGF